ncbi:unnamed protein product [Rotaria sordida]|uniref:Uncharacterized protein n=1 Tax=Rotaria sordida TaxID=392033 RepID=A0A814V4U1_9BILA|nr:unnamed protein product [Rotaria sordida]CAF1443288.1 unnamed protein product [Rotaria sordida]
MDTLANNYEYSNFTIENSNSNEKIINEYNCINFPYNQQSKSHCQKCGRRTRNRNPCINNGRIKCEQRHCRHGHRLKCKRQSRHFPTELSSCSMITQTNDHHSISKNILNQNSSRKSSQTNILIDQFIQVQQLNSTRCNTQNHSYTYNMHNDYKNDEYQIFTDIKNKQNSYQLECVQQMIYLRENINNLTYREFHFPNEYILLKRLEEKNHLINQNRFKVDHCFRSLQLQYQIMSTLLQNITITSFNYSKQDSDEVKSIVKTSLKRCSLAENLEFNQNTSNDIIHHSALTNDRSLLTINEINNTNMNENLIKQNDNLSITNQNDSSIFLTPYNEYNQQQYSQNATQSYFNTNSLTELNQQDFQFDTAVIIDVTQCPQVTTKKTNFTQQPSIQDNWNHIKPTFSNKNQNNEHITRTTLSMPILQNNQQESSPIYIPNQTIYFDQYPNYMNIYQPQTMFLPLSYNSNHTHQQPISNPICHEALSYETICFPTNSNQSNELQHLTANHLSFNQNPTNTSSSIHETSESQNSLSVTNSETISNTSTTRTTSNKEMNQSIKYTQTINKIKQILNTLQKNLLHKSCSKTKNLNKKIHVCLPSKQITSLNFNQTSNKINKSITTDSLISNTSIQTTYSVTSTLPISNKTIFQLPYDQSTINLENEILQMDLDSLNLNKTKVLNSAKNINTNQQTSDDDDDETEQFLNNTRSRSKKSISRRVTVKYMSPSFMFVLQILLILCLINRIIMYSFFGIVSNDTLTSIIVDKSQSVTSISSSLVSKTEQTTLSTNHEKFNNFLSSLFKLI